MSSRRLLATVPVRNIENQKEIHMTTNRLVSSLRKRFGRKATILIFDGAVTDNALLKFWKQIFETILKNPHQHFILVITTSGGSFDATRDFYAKVKFYNVTLTTIGVGRVWSAGLTLLLAGGKRFATKHTDFLLHLGNMDDHEEESLNQCALRRLLASVSQTDQEELAIILENVTATEEQIMTMMREETYFSADVALRLGFIHDIL